MDRADGTQGASLPRVIRRSAALQLTHIVVTILLGEEEAVWACVDASSGVGDRRRIVEGSGVTHVAAACLPSLCGVSSVAY